jgi:hypothetical protein
MKLKTLYKSVVEHAIHVAVLVRLIPTPDHIETIDTFECRVVVHSMAITA